MPRGWVQSAGSVRRPGCWPGLRSFERFHDERSARRAAFAPIESFNGGVKEFVEFIPNRRRNSAFSASKVSTRATNPTISAANSSYNGCGGLAADTTQTIDDQNPTTDPDTPSQITDAPSHQDQLSTTDQLNRTREWTHYLL